MPSEDHPTTNSTTARYGDVLVDLDYAGSVKIEFPGETVATHACFLDWVDAVDMARRILRRVEALNV